MKWIESRRENAASTIHGRDQIGDYEVAVKNDGTILGIKARTIADLGSYLQLLTPAIPTLTGLVLTGCYKIPAVKMDVVGVYTNKMSTDAYRGAGRPEATYLIERLMDVVAHELGDRPGRAPPEAFPRAVASFRSPRRAASPTTAATIRARSTKARELANWDQLLAKDARQRARGRAAVRHRRLDLRRDLRDGTVEGDAGGRLGVGLRPHGDLRRRSP